MHIHAAALDAKVAAALASANAQHAIPQDTFVQLPGHFAGVGSVWVAWRAGDATSATPFAGRLETQDQALAASSPYHPIVMCFSQATQLSPCYL